ncbi:hypothetical protein M3Y94_01007500 [Aphelenchoides besseyi]|nr:hypothetical protein M3Y94_01007500 [Aphelenchoides besseyi]KAI6220454.1 hypothetical protein M3Y95_01041700 [Aphelenchoides besseyi]
MSKAFVFLFLFLFYGNDDAIHCNVGYVSTSGGKTYKNVSNVDCTDYSIYFTQCYSLILTYNSLEYNLRDCDFRSVDSKTRQAIGCRAVVQGDLKGQECFCDKDLCNG